VAWLEESERVRTSAVVSAAFYEALLEGPDELLPRLLDPEQREFVAYARDVLPSRLETVEKFSHRSFADLRRRPEAVRRRLLEVGGLEGELLADEFVYLFTHSWLVAKTRRILDELKRAGVRVREYARGPGETLVHEMVAAVIPQAKIPSELTPELIKRAAIKWVVVGGAAAGLTALGPIGAAVPPIAAALAPFFPPGVRAFDP
jgi:hypothetical protein